MTKRTPEQQEPLVSLESLRLLDLTCYIVVVLFSGILLYEIVPKLFTILTRR